jgi:indolepyruvate ferredoxin oxidoreductase
LVSTEDSVEEVLASLNAANHATGVEIARIPEQIKGYGHVKERNLKVARLQWQGLMAAVAQSRGGQKDGLKSTGNPG